MEGRLSGRKRLLTAVEIAVKMLFTIFTLNKGVPKTHETTLGDHNRHDQKGKFHDFIRCLPSKKAQGRGIVPKENIMKLLSKHKASFKERVLNQAKKKMTGF